MADERAVTFDEVSCERRRIGQLHAGCCLTQCARHRLLLPPAPSATGRVVTVIIDEQHPTLLNLSLPFPSTPRPSHPNRRTECAC